MKWTEVSILTSQEALELVSNFLIELGSQGVVLEDISSSGFPSTSFPIWDRDIPDEMKKQEAGSEIESCCLKGYFPHGIDLKEIIERMSGYLTMLDQSEIGVGSKIIQTRVLQEEDWESSWKQYFKPIELGKHLIIKPAWESYPLEPHHIVIDIDPGMAFGTGKHETTQLCLELLEERVYPEVRVLDVGTGSGILAIAAAKLGASQVLGLDTDSIALQYAWENVTRNAVQAKVSLQEGSLSNLDYFGQPFDLIVVNIRPQVILSLIESLKVYLKPEGILILSGILQSELETFTEALERKQLIIKEQRVKEEWVALVCMGMSTIHSL